MRAALPDLGARLVYAPGKAYGGELPVAPRVVTTLAAEGTVVRGDNAGGWKISRPRWTATEQWLGDVPPRPDEATGYAELVGAWLATFGPGTEDDVVWWLGATKAAVRRALATLGAVEVETSAGVGFVVPGDDGPDAGGAPPPEPWPALLPALDPTVMGWKHRDFYLGPHRAQLFDSNGNAGPTAWWDGRVVGGWAQRPDGEVIVVALEDVGADALAALQGEADRLTAWLDGDVVNTIYQSPLLREHMAPGPRP
jgi:hypothetical protein